MFRLERFVINSSSLRWIHCLPRPNTARSSDTLHHAGLHERGTSLLSSLLKQSPHSSTAVRSKTTQSTERIRIAVKPVPKKKNNAWIGFFGAFMTLSVFGISIGYTYYIRVARDKELERKEKLKQEQD